MLTNTEIRHLTRIADDYGWDLDAEYGEITGREGIARDGGPTPQAWSVARDIKRRIGLRLPGRKVTVSTLCDEWMRVRVD